MGEGYILEEYRTFSSGNSDSVEIREVDIVYSMSKKV